MDIQKMIRSITFHFQHFLPNRKKILFFIHPVQQLLFTCGPHGMMLAVKKYCSNNNLDCDFALETIMACGIGICQGCTIIRNYEKNDSYREKYALACIDGPIFNIGELDDTF